MRGLLLLGLARTSSDSKEEKETEEKIRRW